MTKVTCDLCGCTLHSNPERVKLLITGQILDVDKDLCNGCAIRVINKIRSFFDEVKEKEAIRKAGEAACGG